ncbi:chromate transport protein [Clostridium sp. KLE 1755]|nr:chromate transport protein [Clostridium sp. KLE 1755]
MYTQSVGWESGCQRNGNTNPALKITIKEQRGAIMEKKSKVLKKLFFSTLYLSTFTFGGGYVIVTLMKNKFVDELHWIDEEEMLDLVAIAQSSPGAIAVNGAIVVGYKLAGLPGVLLSILGAILPPMIILSAISFFYDAFRSNLIVGTMLKGMQSGVAAVIASVVFDMGSNVVKEKDWLNIAIMAASFLISYLFDINVVLIIIAAAIIGAVRTLLRERKGAKA